MDVEITKAVVSVTEMARMVGLSRARFYQLKEAGIFPQPKVDEVSGRPMYDQDLQRQCVNVRRSNCGINGKAIVFYSRRRDFGTSKQATPKKKSKPKPKADNKHAELIAGLTSLGLVDVTVAQVESALAEEFPNGTANVYPAEVLRTVFVRIQSRDSSK